jgi:glycosyltransferase involved in cell wall biosynthesis
MKINIVFWWNIPCKGIFNVFEECAKINEGKTLIVTGPMSKKRLDMGWEENENLLDNHIVLQPEEYGSKDLNILREYKNYIHVIGGIVFPKYVNTLLLEAIKLKISFFNMSEAYCNMDFTYKRAFKFFYYKNIYPFKHREIAQHSLGVFCLSGGSKFNIEKFNNCFWAENKVFPFGYYTEDAINNNITLKDSDNIHFLCPGNLEVYKGVDILVSACEVLLAKKITNFKVHITGKGSQLKKIKLKVEKLGLNNNILFYGSLSSEKYKDLNRRIDVLIAPGRVEPWGIRVNEAIQRGLAVIVSDGLGASELILESKGGFVFKSGSFDELSNCMSKYIIDKPYLLDAKDKNLKFKFKIHPKFKAKELLDTILLNS